MKTALLRCLIFGALILFVSSSKFVHARERLALVCGGYSIVSNERIIFNVNEKRLICGDQKVPAWNIIPVNQAKFHLSTFLEERGYFFPEFKPQQNGALQIITGSLTLIKELKVDGDPPDFFNIKRRRNVKGEALTPKKMSDLVTWAKRELQSHGYPCPNVTAEAYPETGSLHLIIHPGPFQKIKEVFEEPVPDINKKILRRFDAFDVGKPFDQRYINLTSLRTQDDGLLQSSYFVHECLGDGVKLTQKSIPGKPRLIVVGFGANTEEYGIVKASWKNVRMGTMGSSLDISSYGSFRKQEVSADFKWYLLPTPSRWYLRPTLILTREDEPKYEYISGDLKVLPGFTWDNHFLGLEMFFGPKLNYTHTLKGAQTGLTRFVSLTTEFELTSHEFEYYLPDPKGGYTLTFDMNLNHENMLSDATAQQFRLSGQALWNVLNFDPSLVILGIRGGLASTITDRGSSQFSKLPPDYFYFLGSSLNLRGYSRKELPASTRGALTMAFVSLEARFGHVLPLNIEPFIFNDAGILGDSSLKWDAPLYLSPGVGLRWLSPIGVMRASLAHGISLGETNVDKSHWQFYFSFGEEF